ncbi:MAG: toxin-antitoxin system antitoxin component [Ilumatobacteraceae bacterium]|nr:toxin-antitoxin system antitoxin component [Ilumatobacteraceae bacterium]
MAITELDVLEGLQIAQLHRAADLIGVPLPELLTWARIAQRTWSRRKVTGTLDPLESDRVARAIRLYDRAVDVLGSPEGARTWLHAAQRALDRRTPWQVAATEIGADRVFNLLGRIDHGVLA